MTEPKIMTREQAFRRVDEIARAALGGRLPPDDTSGCDFMDPDDMSDAMAAFGRKLAAQFETLPEQISDDVKVQEVIRAKLDQTLSECALVIEKAIKELGAAD